VSISNAKTGVTGGTAAYPNPLALTLGGGYRFTQYVGVEANYSIIGNSTINTTGAVTATETFKTSSMQVAAVGTYSINDQFDVFGKLGVANNKIDYTGTGARAGTASASKTNLMFGVGGQYNINKQFGVRLQYADLGKVTFAGSTQSQAIKVISVGGVYNF
jgi:OmpA-OmpF porin, OOP family